MSCPKCHRNRPCGCPRSVAASSGRLLYVVVDLKGEPVEAAGPAPFDGYTSVEAEHEARATVEHWDPTWHMVELTQELAIKLVWMARGIN